MYNLRAYQRADALAAIEVSARGIDFPNLSQIFEMKPPEDVKSYIHCAGRTGRAGKSGTAVTLITSAEKTAINLIARHYGIDMQEKLIPSDTDVAEIVAERLTGRLEARLRTRDKLQTERSQRFLSLARSLVENDDELPIITMLLDDQSRQRRRTENNGETVELYFFKI